MYIVALPRAPFLFSVHSKHSLPPLTTVLSIAVCLSVPAYFNLILLSILCLYIIHSWVFYSSVSFFFFTSVTVHLNKNPFFVLLSLNLYVCLLYTDKKENKIIQGKSDGIGCKFKYAERPSPILLNIWSFPHILGSISSFMTLHRSRINYLIYKENFVFFFISVHEPLWSSCSQSCSSWSRG